MSSASYGFASRAAPRLLLGNPNDGMSIDAVLDLALLHPLVPPD